MPVTKIIDLDQAVADWAWRYFDRNATRKQRNLRDKERKKNQKYLDLNVDWNKVRFRDETDFPRLAEDSFDEETTPVTDDAMKDDKVLKGRADGGKTHASILFQTKFTNNTKNQQEYTLKAEKTTRSTCSTNIESGYTRGYEMSVSLKTPCEVFEANAGYHRELTLTNSEGQTIEEELVWGVESQIQVEQEHIAEAQLVVNEKKYSGDFVITSHIRGSVYITFNNIRDNNALVKATSHDIYDILKEFVDQERRKGSPMDFVDFETSPSEVIIRTSGKCNFRYGINQEIKVYQVPLSAGNKREP